ncbi:hypothetical protein HYY71_03300 [Candidatus Woesearchaeota archaeon]|nr:hypothetical protein [Candidatus Woesearchaeota archaeon]
MDDKTQKERLEQELRFLKESFEAEVISKEEFEKGRERIERKLKEIKQAEKGQIPEKQEPVKEQKKDEAVEITETGKIKLRVFQDEHHETHNHPGAETEQKTEQKEAPKEPAPEKPALAGEQKKESKLFRYSAVFVVLILAVFFSYSILKDTKDVQEKTAKSNLVAVCSSNEDCRQEGKEGTCLEPGTKNAKCKFKETPKTSVIVLNDKKNCFNCDSQRVLSIIEEWFGDINAREIDYSTPEGKGIAEKFDAKALPMYILDENITQKPRFEQFKRLFAKKYNNYALSEDVAAANLYIKRENVLNKLDLFVIPKDNASIRAEENLREFLENFKDAKFDRHLSTDKLAVELGIKNFPTFLVNNRVKFSGVHSAETIKEKFCKLNSLPECEKSLSRSLV